MNAFGPFYGTFLGFLGLLIVFGVFCLMFLGLSILSSVSRLFDCFFFCLNVFGLSIWYLSKVSKVFDVFVLMLLGLSTVLF